MRISPKSLFLLVGILAGVFVGGSAGAAPSTTVTWKVSSLMAGEAKNLSAVVSTNSPGVKTWSKNGSCTLTPASKPTKLTMGSTGSCVLTLKIAKSKNYPAKSSSKTISLMVLATTTTTTAKPIASTTVAPITATTVRPTTTTTTTTTAAPSGPAATVSNSGYSFTPSNTRISVGQAVSFNVSSSHNVRWEDGAAGRGTTDAAYSRTFSSAGTYSFLCSIHPDMTGTITVG
jgi:plastocyanin